MLPIPSGSVRWGLLCAITLVALFLWRQPFQQPSPVSTRYYIPQKLYEPESQQSNDNALRPNREIIENPKAPSFPAFKGSAQDFPSAVYNPYPAYNSHTWRRKWKGTHASCLGPRGVEVNGNPDDMLTAHKRETTYGVPRPIFGSYNETGLQSAFCFDRHARYDPYGYDEEELDNGLNSTKGEKLDWDKVDWGRLQGDCIDRNRNRYEPAHEGSRGSIFQLPTSEHVEDVDNTLHFPPDFSNDESLGRTFLWSGARVKERTAVVLNVWHGDEWTLDTTQHIRSMIMELSLHSGGEYEMIILVDMRDKQRLFEDPNVYQEALQQSVPFEFRNISVLYQRTLLEAWYPKTGKHDTGKAQDNHRNQPLQLLSLLRPDIEYFWHIELEARYTGHHYHHLETISAWSKAQPRRLSWERASPFFIPAVHGCWGNFSKYIENTTADGGVWGPVKTEGIEPVGPDPPTESPQNDDYRWGVGEEADFINVGPIFNPANTKFVFANEIKNYPDDQKTPRRATALRLMARSSKRLLRAMHHGQVTLGTHMAPEMFSESTALHHGLKIAAFPLPIFLDYSSSAFQIERKFNKNQGRNTYDLPYKYEGMWHRMTSFSSLDKQATFPDELYKRWLGYSGDQHERLCLPGILLHPIRGV